MLKRTYRKISKNVDAHAAIEALVSLGYPIGRYLREANPSEEFAGGLPKIFARMRTAFYQNRSEFMRLRPILQSRMESMEAGVLRAMASHAEQFSPLWMTREKAESSLEILRRML